MPYRTNKISRAYPPKTVSRPWNEKDEGEDLEKTEERVGNKSEKPREVLAGHKNRTLDGCMIGGLLGLGSVLSCPSS